MSSRINSEKLLATLCSGRFSDLERVLVEAESALVRLGKFKGKRHKSLKFVRADADARSVSRFFESAGEDKLEQIEAIHAAAGKVLAAVADVLGTLPAQPGEVAQPKVTKVEQAKANVSEAKAKRRAAKRKRG